MYKKTTSVSFIVSFLQALSDLQLKALGPDLAAMVTSEQQNALNDKQVAALESAMTGSREESLPPEKYTDGSGKKIRAHCCKFTC